MGRNKERVPFEPEDALRQSIELALTERKKEEPKLTRNELLCRLVRRGLGDEAQAPTVRFACADALTLAEFRGDLEKIERFFVRVRNVMLNRGRCVDKDDPESVERFKEDDRQTHEFLDGCAKLLEIATERAWNLRGFTAKDVEYIQQTALPIWRKWIANRQTDVAQIEALAQKGPLTVEQTNQLNNARSAEKMYSAILALAKFAVLENSNASEGTGQIGDHGQRA